jgi:hypothetical protein
VIDFSECARKQFQHIEHKWFTFERIQDVYLHDLSDAKSWLLLVDVQLVTLLESKTKCLASSIWAPRPASLLARRYSCAPGHRIGGVQEDSRAQGTAM